MVIGQVKLGFLTHGVRHALSVMRQNSLQHIRPTVGMIPYTRYAACGMRQIESLRVAIHAASECRIGRGNPRMTSINYDIPQHPLHFGNLITVAQVL